MRIIGIDPGLDRTGYGLIQTDRAGQVRLVEAGFIRTQRTDTLPQRLASVAQEFQALLSQYRPSAVAVEDLYSYYKTPKPAILMGHVRGVILSCAALAKIPVSNYLPTQIKRSVVGRGHGTKEQIARMVQTRLKLKESQVPADVTDALGVALCHADRFIIGREIPRLWTTDHRRMQAEVSG